MKIYNSLSQTKEDFKPLNDKKVLMYVCGITPYDTTHLGHAFTYLVFDVLVRYLTYKGYEITYTQNVTDIDDSILEKAREVGKNWLELGNFWTKRFLTDLKKLNIKLPTFYVKATDSIEEIIRIIRALEDKGYAYEKNRNVYFRVKKYPGYGSLSKFTREQMILISKERGADPDDPNKKDPLDFILWQSSKTDEPFWESPWGKGRPGWHIECSAMISQYLGPQIDIHGGGRDLIYPHHESERAQSEIYTRKSPFIKYWMHTGMVMYQGEKMSKSLGNLILIKDLLKNYSANAIRWLLLSNYYPSPWEYWEQDLKDAEKIVKKALARSKSDGAEVEPGFIKALENDLNTQKALQAIIHSKNPYQMLKILGFTL